MFGWLCLQIASTTVGPVSLWDMRLNKHSTHHNPEERWPWHNLPLLILVFAPDIKDNQKLAVVL